MIGCYRPNLPYDFTYKGYVFNHLNLHSFMYTYLLYHLIIGAVNLRSIFDNQKFKKNLLIGEVGNFSMKLF